jgi:hypothetical protein
MGGGIKLKRNTVGVTVRELRCGSYGASLLNAPIMAYGDSLLLPLTSSNPSYEPLIH